MQFERIRSPRTKLVVKSLVFSSIFAPQIYRHPSTRAPNSESRLAMQGSNPRLSMRTEVSSQQSWNHRPPLESEGEASSLHVKVATA